MGETGQRRVKTSATIECVQYTHITNLKVIAIMKMHGLSNIIAFLRERQRGHLTCPLTL